MKILIMLMVVVMAAPVAAREIYKCHHQGVTLYSHLPCGGNAVPVELPALGRLGSREDAQTVRQRLRTMRSWPAAEPQVPAHSTAEQRGLSYGERTQLRKLEMRADNLRRDLLNGRGDPRWRQATDRELRSLQKQIDGLRARQ